MKKIKLNNLRISSFITQIESTEKQTLKGGFTGLLCLFTDDSVFTEEATSTETKNQ